MSTICYHTQKYRIDDNFVKCKTCGLTIIEQTPTRNKTMRDFIKEDASFIKNFNRYFTNVVDYEQPEQIDYYADRVNNVPIVINWAPHWQSGVRKYNVIVDRENVFLTEDQFRELITRLNAVKMDEQQFNLMYMQKNWCSQTII